MKKIVLLASVLFIVAVFLFAADPPKRFAARGISIDVPAGWSVKEGKGSSLVSMNAPKAAGEQTAAVCAVSFVAVKMKSSREYIEKDMVPAINKMSKSAIFEQKDDYIVYEGSFIGPPVRKVDFVHMDNERAYIVSFRSTPASFDKYRKIFFETAGSFKIVK